MIVTYNHHLRMSKYLYSTGHWSLNGEKRVSASSLLLPLIAAVVVTAGAVTVNLSIVVTDVAFVIAFGDLTVGVVTASQCL